jgi:single-strand DNA-binding protein
MSYQKIIIVGHLGADPEMDFAPSGQARTRFSIATNRSFNRKDGEKVNETTWFRVTTWGKQAETCNQFLHKGSQVLIEGRLSSDPDTGGPHIWTRQDGSPATSYELSVETIRFLNGKNGNGNNAEAVPQEDEIPF